MYRGTELAVFRNILREYRALIACAVGGSTIPLAAAFGSLTPAWPSAISGVTAVAQLVVLVLVFQSLRFARRKVVTRAMIRATAILCILFPAYLALIALFTYAEPHSGLRFTKGFICTQDATLVFQDKCPLLTYDEIAVANYEEDRIWTPTSLTAMKLIIVITWLVCFGTLSVTLASFVVFQTAQKADRPS
jgi:hypothetical protein